MASNDKQISKSKIKSQDTSSLPHIPWLQPDLVKPKKKRPYFETSDLVIIALFSSLGGIFSTFTGYFANLLNSILGIPFGGGQIFSGIHIFWLVFIFLLTDRKPGTVFLVGLLKGFIEFFTGNAHGVLVILLSTTQGLMIELILIIFYGTKRNFILIVSAGLASISNVVLQQMLFFNSQIPLVIIGSMIIVSFISGIFWGGVLPISVYQIFQKTGILDWRKISLKSPRIERQIKFIRITFIIVLIIVEVVLVSMFLFQSRYAVQITGDVFNPYTFYLHEFPQITIEAELNGSVTYVPLRNYTGVPLLNIIEKSQPKSNMYNIEIRAIDGYNVHFNSTELNQNPNIIVSAYENGLRIVAKDYHGSFWIRNINNIRISNNEPPF
jgi:energy-coupling factor transport system substrate-specific component